MNAHYQTKEIIMNVLPLIQWHLQLITWRDAVEIFFFSLMFYSLTRWLATDNEKNLLPYFYGYCSVALLSYACQLPTLTYCLFLFSPAVILLFMLLHQETLQRNMIALKNITAAAPASRDWLELFLRNILKALHHNTSMLLLIEHTDALAPYLKVSFPLEAQITQGMFNLIIEKQLYDPASMLWVKSDGSIRGLNATWKASWNPEKDNDENAWIEDAIAYTSKTDALVLNLDPNNHSCTVAVEGTLYKNLSIDQTAQLIKKRIEYPLSSTIKKGLEYGITNKKEPMAQRTP